MSKSLMDQVIPEFILIFILFEMMMLTVSLNIFFSLLSLDAFLLSTVQRTEMYLEIPLWIGIILLILSKIPFTIKQFKHPFRDLPGHLRPLNPEDPLQVLATQVGKDEGFKSISVLMSESASDMTSFGDLSKEAFVILSKRIVETLNQNQLRSVILHELYHATSGTRDYFASQFANKLGWIRFFLLGLIITALFSPLRSPDSESFISSPQFLPMLSTSFAILVVVLVAITLIVAVITLIRIQRHQGTPPSRRYAYADEFIADAYSVSKSNDPNSLESALLLSSVTQAGMLHSASLTVNEDSTNELESDFKNTKLKEILRMKPLNLVDFLRVFFEFIVRGKYRPNRICPMQDRILMIRKLRRLLEKKIACTVKMDVATPSHTNCLPPHVQLLLRMRPDAFHNFMSYAKAHTSDFNLKECSNDIKLDTFETFLLLVAGVECDILDVQV